MLVIDDCQQLTTNTARCDLDYLVRLGTHASAGLTVVQVAQRDLDRPSDPNDSWMLAVGLVPLTRSQVECYLATKLGAVGCNEPTFTPRAITRLQALSEGVPRGNSPDCIAEFDGGSHTGTGNRATRSCRWRGVADQRDAIAATPRM